MKLKLFSFAALLFSIGTYFYLTNDTNDALNSSMINDDSHATQQSKIEAQLVETADLLKRKEGLGTVNQVEPIATSAISTSSSEDSDSLAEGQEKVLEELIEIFGEGEVIPITDPEAQDRLLSKFRTDNEKRINDKLKTSEYDPKYDSTWTTDLQSKALNEFSNYFPDDAFVEEYSCLDNSVCSLKISRLNSERVMLAEAAGLMNSLKDTPAIAQSGQSRVVFICYVCRDVTGYSVVRIESCETRVIQAQEDKKE
jgi:hypothetical protein